MNEQDKAELVKYRLKRARETYNEVSILVKNELWNTAIELDKIKYHNIIYLPGRNG